MRCTASFSPLALGLLFLLGHPGGCHEAARLFATHCNGTQWAEAYGVLHNATNATLTLDLTARGCPGLGNLFYMAYRPGPGWFVVAYLCERAFFLRLPERCDVGVALHSPFFDWHRNDTWGGARTLVTVAHVLGPKKAQHLNHAFGSQPPAQLLPAQHTVVVAGTLDTPPFHILRNPHLTDRIAASPLFQLTPTARHGCIHHLLFSPRTKLRESVAKHLNAVGKDAVGVHIRLGDTLSGLVPPRKNHRDKREPPRWRCADAAMRNGSAYLAADSPDQVPRWQVRYGEARVFTEPGAPLHTAHSKNFTGHNLHKVLVDFQVVCRTARRFLTASSTFSTEAFYCAFGQRCWTLNHPACEPFRPHLD